MPKFKIYGANSNTGEDTTIVITADTPTDAEAVASGRGVFVSRIVEMEDPPPMVVERSVAPIPPSQIQQGIRHQAGHSPAAPTININTPKRSSSLGVVSVILGTIALLICWIPFIGILALLIAGVGILLAGIGLLVSLGRRGAGIGWPIGGVVLCVIPLMVAIAQISVIGAAGNAISQVANESVRLQTEWEPPTGMTKDDISIGVVNTTIGKVPLESKYYEDKKSETKSDRLMITFSISDYSDRRKIDVSTLQPDFSFGDNASLEDENGNTYSRVTFGSILEYVPTISQGPDTIAPGETKQFILVFETPIPQAKKLKLSLPASRIGGRGTIVLEFDAPQHN